MQIKFCGLKGKVRPKIHENFNSTIEISFVRSIISFINRCIHFFTNSVVTNNVVGCNVERKCILVNKSTYITNTLELNQIFAGMKKFFLWMLIISSSFIFWGCSKTADTVETKDEMVVRLLTGGGNKVWRLSGLFVNDIAQTLTDAQTKFTKTYRADPTNADPANSKTGTFTNSDGYIGTWKLINGAAQLYEKFTNNPVGPVAVPYIINSITDSKLDIEYTQNFKSVREVYNGY